MFKLGRAPCSINGCLLTREASHLHRGIAAYKLKQYHSVELLDRIDAS
jgi:hypothetical protein